MHLDGCFFIEKRKNMTVKELIEKLSKLDQDRDIYIEGVYKNHELSYFCFDNIELVDDKDWCHSGDFYVLN